MISRKQGDTIKKLLGMGFLNVITQRLSSLGINKKSGKEYSGGYISAILSGTFGQSIIEDAIWDLAEEKALEIQEKQKRREALMMAAEELTND